MIGSREVKNAAAQAGNDDRVRLLARLGYAAKGTFYAVIGVLALQLAAGTGGETTDTRGAIQHIGQAPFGKLLLVLVAAGLVGLVLWRFIQAIQDVDGHGRTGEGIIKRVALGISGMIYAGLLAATLRLLMGRPSAGGSGTQAWTARVMEAPLGRAAVATAGIALMVWGLTEAFRGVKGKLSKQLHLDGAAARQAKWIRPVSRFGLVSRGLVFTLMGGFLIQAAVRFDPSRAKGLGEILGTLASRPMGSVLLGVVALGFIAYALYAFLEARYRTFDASR